LQPLVSIIIPTYNRAHLIGETLDSVINQNYQNWECIAVDDGSIDHTDQLMGFYSCIDPRIKYYHRPPHLPKGANSCRNYGFTLSKGEYINFFDSDDLMEPDKLVKQINAFEGDVEIDFSLCEYSLHDYKMRLKHLRPYDSDNLLINYITEKAFFNLQTTLFRRSSIKTKFDETLFKAQELEFFLRFLQQPILKYRKIDAILVKVRLHNNNITTGFTQGNLLAINSEMDVRLKIIKTLLSIGSVKDVHLALQIYTRFLFQILSQGKTTIFFKYCFKLFYVLPLRYYTWILKLFFMGSIIVVTKKEPYRLRNILNLGT